VIIAKVKEIIAKVKETRIEKIFHISNSVMGIGKYEVESYLDLTGPFGQGRNQMGG